MMPNRMSDSSFDNYFGGQVNAATVEALHNIADPSTPHARVTILEGKSGTGKTHLLRALELESESTYDNIKYISVGEINRLVEIAAAKGNEAFQDLTAQLTTTRLLMVDNVMYASGKEFTTWYLFEIIKRMDPSSSIVFAGDIVLEGFIQELKEITSSIQHLRLFFPGAEDLRKIVWYKASKFGIEDKLNDNLVERILDCINFKPYKIDGAINFICAKLSQPTEV